VSAQAEVRASDTGDAYPDESSNKAIAVSKRRRHLWLWAVLLVIPYLLLGMAWVFSNPPSAAPDEADHLIKALGVARLNIGTPYTGAPRGPSPGQSRNASIARVVPIPRALNPAGFDCTARKSTVSAACLPTSWTGGSGIVDAYTTMGSYPPFTYLPIGLVARTADNPARAIHLGRLAVLVMSSGLLVLGMSYLLRWVGPAAAIGPIVALTPMAVFCTAILSTSGVELTSAVTLACVAGVTLVKPKSLLSRSAHWTAAIAGSALLLSRQLGLISGALLLLVILFAAGTAVIRQLLKEHRPSFIGAVVALVVSGAATAWWEHTYDHPNQLGSPLHLLEVRGFLRFFPATMQSGVGNFGWIDTPLPNWTVFVWVAVAVTLVGAALILGHWRSRTILLGLLGIGVVVSYVTYAIVFYPVHSGLQGRDVLALFIGVPVIAGVVLSSRLASLGLRRELRQFVIIGSGLIALVQFTAIYANGHRYASGINSPWWYLSSSQWSPHGGWWLWLAVALVGAVLLAVMPALAMQKFPLHKWQSLDPHREAHDVAF
jgi:hypothetical protein